MLTTRRLVSQRIRYGSLFACVCLVWIGSFTVNVLGASSIAQGFIATGSNMVAGAVVSLKEGAPNAVELANRTNTDNLLGVVGEESSIELDGGSVQIVTSGTGNALVSNINGDIKTGDKITSSPISGVGMKATSDTLIIGTAQANLKSVELKPQVIVDRKGTQQIVKVGVIPLQIDKVYYHPDDSTFLPIGLQNLANSIAGHQVSAVRVLIASVLVLLLFVIVGVLLYAAVRSSIISIGRNPLSERAVRKGLTEVGLTVLGVLIFAAIAVYLLLAV